MENSTIISKRSPSLSLFLAKFSIPPSRETFLPVDVSNNHAFPNIFELFVANNSSKVDDEEEEGRTTPIQQSEGRAILSIRKETIVRNEEQEVDWGIFFIILREENLIECEAKAILHVSEGQRSGSSMQHREQADGVDDP